MASSAFESVRVSAVAVHTSIALCSLWDTNIVKGEKDPSLLFVNVALLDRVIGLEIPNTSRKMSSVLSQFIEESVNVKDILVSQSVGGHRVVCLAIRAMQLVLLHGFKGLPWNDLRRGLLHLFYPEEFIAMVDPQFNNLFTPMAVIIDNTVTATETPDTTVPAR